MTALRGLARVARQHGLGIVVDVVPNHMAIPTPASLNPQFWDVLRQGRDSAYAHWFDVDWELCDGRLGLPVLGEPFDEAIGAGALAIDEHEGEQVVRYRGGQVFPIADGTSGGSVADVLGRQRYLLASWREKARTLGYRRFFDVDTLIAVQVEQPDVFEATHRVLLDLHADGVVDGFRIDHPDGLSDPQAYLARLREATHNAWAVVEKILSAGEALPSSWRCDGTTGYDAVEAVQAALAPPTGRELDTAWRVQDGSTATLEDVELAAKRLVVGELLQPELLRLSRRAREAASARGSDVDEHTLASAFAAVLEHIDAYRAYVRLDEPVPDESANRLDAWCDRAAAAHPESADGIRLVRELVGDSWSTDPATRDLVVRFQQVCGPVMAKGVEDTTFYRWNKLISLNEVGGDPSSIDDPDPTLRLDQWAERQATDRPHGMTALSTHDTKRDEDVRARIATAAEWSDRWTEVSTATQSTASELGIDRPTAYLVMQTVVGAWPITEERLLDYVLKAAREAKAQTTWTAPDERYEAALGDLVRSVVRPGELHSLISRWVADLDEPAAANDLAAKLVQLTLPGVPDVYQGCDAVSRSLVDPDNRRPVDYAARRERLRMLDDGDAARDLGDRKLLRDVAGVASSSRAAGPLRRHCRLRPSRHGHTARSRLPARRRPAVDRHPVAAHAHAARRLGGHRPAAAVGPLARRAHRSRAVVRRCLVRRAVRRPAGGAAGAGGGVRFAVWAPRAHDSVALLLRDERLDDEPRCRRLVGDRRRHGCAGRPLPVQPRRRRAALRPSGPASSDRA